jgi:NADPH:quinone reductase-like Zn-dependent oxidoreductase
MNGAELRVLNEMIEAGQITPVIDKVYPLDKTADALRQLENEHAQGKIVISVVP